LLQVLFTTRCKVILQIPSNACVWRACACD
jgi:hypothetical protein